MRYLEQAKADASDARLFALTIAISGFVFVLALAILIASFIVGFAVSSFDVLKTLGLLGGSIGFTLYVQRRTQNRIFTYVAAFATNIQLASMVLILASYLAAVAVMPLQDSLFATIDQELGFDWHSTKTAFQSHPWIWYGAGVLYSMLDKQLLFVGLVASLALRFRELQVFTIAWLMAACFTLVISALMPALGAYHHYGVVAEMQLLAPVSAGYIHLAQVEAIRSGAMFAPFADPVGIIVFPSFHAAGGVMLAWVFWHITWLRWPMLLINLGMIAATPIMGSHFFIDILAGLVTACLAIVIAKRIVARFAPAS